MSSLRSDTLYYGSKPTTCFPFTATCSRLSDGSCVYGVKRHIQQYFCYIVAICFIGGENRTTVRKPQIRHNRSTTSGTLLCLYACILLLFPRSMHIVRLDKEDANGRRNLAWIQRVQKGYHLCKFSQYIALMVVLIMYQATALSSQNMIKFVKWLQFLHFNLKGVKFKLDLLDNVAWSL